ncbi:MAG TPA: alpha-1,4-glucan--maltose-1-phosphate maltosyltransferase [Flavipsychrobacter sp.]|jgi:starch synthase (maltosyl-transferring)|nr:alpha-1,4-glucan--maltose-1-phosphate maltosyltransferase [Flavipsychrobacter sp.]
MINLPGRKRVVITNVVPQIDCGKYPAKGVIDDEFLIAADIFTDGHDNIQASVLIRQKKDRSWKEYPMRFINNDHWECSFYPSKTGFYQFQIQGWVDTFSTWRSGLLKKHEAGQDIRIELQIGASLIEHAASRIATKEKNSLLQFGKSLTEAANAEDAILIATNDQLAAQMDRGKDKNLITVYPQIFEFEIEVKRAGFSAWYELFPRSTAPEPGKHGTFKDVKSLLPRIVAMGFDTLYFPPIHPIGEEKRKGKNNSLTATEADPGSPWAIGNRTGGHKAIHPQLGSLKDFQDLIKEARKHDIEIAMDIAYQCAPDHPYVKQHPKWFKWRPDGTVQYAENPPKKYEDILPFNFETEDWENLWTELRSVVEYWIDKGVKVFRIDNPHTKSFAFWEWMIGEVRKQNPEVIFLAEAFTRPRIMERLAKAGFNQSYNYFTWRNSKKEIEEYMTELTKTDMRYYFRPNFWPNTPDILPPEITYGGENALIRRLILAATLSSNYGLYGPVYEFGYIQSMPGKEEYSDNEKYEIKHWDWQAYSRIKELITRVNRIRKENTALQTTYNIEFAETTNEQIVCYVKTDKKTGNQLIIAVNLDSWNTQGANVTLPLEKTGLPEGEFIVRDLLSGDKYRWNGAVNFVQLNPYEMPAHIFKLEPLTNQ